MINGHGYTNSFNDIIKPMPIRDYGVVLDCGSSGTRVFVYTWLRPAQTQEDTLLDIAPLEDEHGAPVQLKVEPGLSSFADNVGGLEGHIKPLISIGLLLN